MSENGVSLFYEGGETQNVGGIIDVARKYSLTYCPGASSFSITIPGKRDLRESLEALFEDGLEAYPTSVLSDRKGEAEVEEMVKEKGGFLAGLGDSEDLTYMRKINYGIKCSDFFRILEIVGYASKAIGF